MKTLWYLSVVIILLGCSRATVNKNNYIDPTGTYELESDIRQEGGDTYGYTGQIQVKKLKTNKIAMTFSINKGAPNYNSGSFIDTLDYQSNRSVYRADPAIDSSCRISFVFAEEEIAVEQQAENYNVACGFGYGVVAEGIFTKTTSVEPVLKHPMTGEEIEG